MKGSMKERFRVITAAFLSAYSAAGILAGVYVFAFAHLGISPLQSLDDMVMYAIFVCPLLATVTGWVVFIKHGNTNPYLWVNSLVWLIPR